MLLLYCWNTYIAITGTSLEVEHRSYMTCHSTLHIIWFIVMSRLLSNTIYCFLVANASIMQHCVTMHGKKFWGGIAACSTGIIILHHKTILQLKKIEIITIYGTYKSTKTGFFSCCLLLAVALNALKYVK